MIALLLGCQHQFPKNTNLLLAGKVQVQYFMSIKDTTYSKLWVRNFNKKYLYENTIQQVFNNNFEVYNPDNTDFSKSNGLMKKQEILNYLNWDTVSNDYDELNEIVFWEEWQVDTNLKKFTKVVRGWAPVRDYFKNNNKSRMVRRKIFYVF
ncbi:MAG: hypothetical protein DRP35_07915, partial [Candidatus Zixiibacteriota bacterium]